MREALAFPNASRLALGAGLVAFPLLLGAGVGIEPRLAVLIVLLVTVAVWVTLRGAALAWWDLMVFALGGLYLLEYGFTNVGVPGPVPLPLVDLIAVLLMLRAATRPGFHWPGSLPFVLAAAFVALTAVRLSVDYPRHGMLAVRDATLAVELSFLFIGYWVIKEYGLDRLVRVLSPVFVLGLVYLAFYPVREAIQDASPQVGIQRVVPLVGNYYGSAGVLVGAFFFFALVQPFGKRSYILAAATLPAMAMMQSRGLYLFVPAAIGLVWVLARARAGTQVRRGLAATLAVGALALVVFFPIAPDQGRVGKLSPTFVVAQLSTLTGKEGPGASVDQRTEWVDRVVDEVERTPWGWAVGVGLGPDLAFGFQNDAGALVRKPHNDYLEIFARLGVLGFGLFVGMLAFALLRVIQGARRASGLEAQFLWFAVAQSVVFALISATQPLLAFSYGTIPMFAVLGAALAVAEQVPRASAPHRVRR